MTRALIFIKRAVKNSMVILGGMVAWKIGGSVKKILQNGLQTLK